MGRPPLDLGTHGKFRTYQAGAVWRSRCYVRDYDGVVRECERTGRSAAAAERALGKALRDRARIDAGADITSDTKLAWLVDPATKAVTVYRSATPGPTLRDDAVLNGEDVVPGFTLPLGVLFAQPDFG